MDDPIRSQYLNDGYEALHPSFVQEITQLRPLIGKIVAFLEQMHGDETHDYRVTVSVLLTGRIADAADNCPFELAVTISGRGEERKLRLELTDPNGWGTSPGEAKPVIQLVGYVRLPPYDCVAMEDEWICPTCRRVERECTCSNCLLKKKPPREM